MQAASTGDIVQVHYTGTLEDGRVFDSSEGRDPLQFTLGAGQVIPGFEQAVTGMTPGDERRVTIPADDAYGQRREDLMLAIDRGELPDGMDPEVGQQLQMSQQGQTFVVTIRDVSTESVTLDANHPLAGEDLTFELKLVGIGD
jgi:FKBP-type peptidyl-prolyl cis-trans isomerase 2